MMSHLGVVKHPLGVLRRKIISPEDDLRIEMMSHLGVVKHPLGVPRKRVLDLQKKQGLMNLLKNVVKENLNGALPKKRQQGVTGQSSLEACGKDDLKSRNNLVILFFSQI